VFTILLALSSSFVFYALARAEPEECSRYDVTLERPPLNVVIIGRNEINQEGEDFYSPSRGRSAITLTIPLTCDGARLAPNSLEGLHTYFFEALSSEGAKDILRYYQIWLDGLHSPNITHADILALREFVEAIAQQGGIPHSQLECAGTRHSPYSALIISAAAQRIERDDPDEYDNWGGGLTIELSRNLWNQCQIRQ
jgi:hypothetical protein